MKIVLVRQISQCFFFLMFGWFCVVSTLGDKFWQLRAWPVNWFLQLDPLAALATILTTHTLYGPLLWALATVILTIVFGRFFCGWVCPFGSIHHFVGYLANRKSPTSQNLRLNKYRKAQSIKYFVLVFFLAMAAFPSIAATLQTGLLDPIPLVTRSFNLLLLPILDRPLTLVSVTDRFYEGAWLIFAVFATAVLLNLVIPRFFCRFICPLGALLAILGRFAIWQIGKTQPRCSDCGLCQTHCQGACEPAAAIRSSECLLCFNCRQDCPDQLIAYQTTPSLAGRITDPDISRRGFVLSLLTGIFATPALRLANKLGPNYQPTLIRPPGALPEEQFLKRCIKCGQCIRVCPTNVIQPAGIDKGLECLWTPALNNRIGSSACQLNCVACGQVCPTAAIRPITLAEKLGNGPFTTAGPIKLGTAFIDQNRCLPWAMDKPCIVCQENCPLSPKAIYTREYFSTIRDAVFTVKKATQTTLQAAKANFSLDKFATGDYYCAVDGSSPKKIIANTQDSIEISHDQRFREIPAAGSKMEIQIRLQRPFIDIEKCIGCGICEHECPVSGRKAVAVSAEGETRSAESRLLLQS